MLHSPFPSIVQNLYNVRLSYQETPTVAHVNAFLTKSIYLKMIIKNRAILDISKNDHMNKYQGNKKMTTDYIRKRLAALFPHKIFI